ncbi:MAG: hypothetical protein JO168_05630 [Solirubrobacterales bacterium]|nr:hypothetical protein [Solirubrobacterales bacterium]
MTISSNTPEAHACPAAAPAHAAEDCTATRNVDPAAPAADGLARRFGARGALAARLAVIAAISASALPLALNGGTPATARVNPRPVTIEAARHERITLARLGLSAGAADPQSGWPTGRGRVDA